VLDLRLTLGIEAVEDNENTRIVVLSISGPDRQLTIGLRADRVFEVTVLDQDELDPPPAISAAWHTHSIAGIGRRNGAFVTVIDLDRLLSGVDIPPPRAIADQAA
jgi:purine-binding chemotaxis protein CheW